MVTLSGALAADEFLDGSVATTVREYVVAGASFTFADVGPVHTV